MNEPGAFPNARVFEVEDEFHGDLMESFENYNEALTYLERIVQAPWGTDPNDPPCGNMSCERSYVITEYESTGKQSLKVGQRAAVLVSAEGVVWQKPGPAHE